MRLVLFSPGDYRGPDDVSRDAHEGNAEAHGHDEGLRSRVLLHGLECHALNH